MTVQDILTLPGITPVHLEADRAVDTVFCCDLLSVAMARAPESCAWVTVIGNNNAVGANSLVSLDVISVACLEVVEVVVPNHAFLYALELNLKKNLQFQ